MIPTLGLMLSIYLVFKGVEIWQMALCSSREDKSTPILIGTLSLIASIVIGGFFGFFWLTTGTSSVPNLNP
jgi:hypothetical protein